MKIYFYIFFIFVFFIDLFSVHAISIGVSPQELFIEEEGSELIIANPNNEILYFQMGENKGLVITPLKGSILAGGFQRVVVKQEDDKQVPEYLFVQGYTRKQMVLPSIAIKVHGKEEIQEQEILKTYGLPGMYVFLLLGLIIIGLLIFLLRKR